QSFEDALQAAAFVQIDDWIFGGIENVTGGDDVGTTEQDDAVAVGRRPLVEDLDRVTVERQILLCPRINVVRPPLFGKRRLGGLIAQSIEDRAEADDEDTRLRRARDGQRPAEPREVRVAARMIASLIRIDDVADLPLR